MNQPPVCRDCGLAMEPGIQIDRGDHNIPTPSEWAPGLPEERKFWGMRWYGLSGRQVKAALSITAFRCPQCGLLDSYAWPPPPT